MAVLSASEFGKPSTAVKEVETMDGAVLLDMRQSLCLSMRPFSLKVWRLLKLGRTMEDITDSLSTEFPDVSKEDIHDNVVQFVTALRQKGLLLQHEPISRSGLTDTLLRVISWRYRAQKRRSKTEIRPRRFLTLKALFSLLAFDLLGFGTNFPKTYFFVQRWPVAPRSAPHDIVEQICNAINYACVWYPKRVLCLQRSSVTTCLARAHGVSAQMVIAAQKLPFKAHAWTEIDGQPVNERRSVKNWLIWERC